MLRKLTYLIRAHQKYNRQLYIVYTALLILGAACSGKNDDSSTDYKKKHTVHDQHAGKTQEDAYLSTIAKSTNKYVISDQQTIKVSAAPGEADFSGTGYIRSDERRNVKVAARFDGRIEELHVKYNYAFVRKGQPIMELYSPTLNTMQQELRYLRRHPEDTALLAQARQRLRLLGLSDRQIKKFEMLKPLKPTVPIESPAEGYVLFVGATAVLNSEMKNPDQREGMRNMREGDAESVQSSVIGGTTLRKGTYVKAGQTLFEVNDFRVIWAIISVDARHMTYLQEGAPVKIYSELQPDKTITGKINLIEPVYELGQKFVTVRVYLPNEDMRLKAGSLVRATIAGGSKELLAVPNSAVMDLGRKKIVWVMTGKTPEGKKVFEAREVKIGSSSALSTYIISGLEAGQQIASDAGLLADSESFIEAAVN